MKFIVDAQLPKSLADLLVLMGHDAIHTLQMPNKNTSSDKEICKLATAENRVLITKDNDFLDSYLLHSEPQKLILISTGNISNKQLLTIFELHLGFIEICMERNNLIEITNSDIVEHE